MQWKPNQDPLTLWACTEVQEAGHSRLQVVLSNYWHYKNDKHTNRKLFSLQTQRFTHTLWNVFKKTAVAYGADLLAIELNGEVVSGLAGHHSLENLLLSWARRVVGDDCLEIRVLLMFFQTTREKLGVFLSFTKLKNEKNAVLRFILCPS